MTEERSSGCEALERAMDADRRRGRCAFRPREEWMDGPSGAKYEPVGHEGDGSWTICLPNELLASGEIKYGNTLEVHRCRHCGCLFTEVTP